MNNFNLFHGESPQNTPYTRSVLHVRSLTVVLVVYFINGFCYTQLKPSKIIETQVFNNFLLVNLECF
ncbi:hypothetical protein HanXRQr2_Chr15g0680291 [Helianthus annuus]|uniref:Uncharacterized protein n=1 Tax=Helianthus annuus TaxID=4232 RepID=A0A9K3E032_HELAN|nr:hypothetical protein HanXRQr2_Chr15g0680291 [Helianthus annuus]